MKDFFLRLTSIVCILLLTIFISSCGKKDATTGSGSTDSKKETTSGSGSSEIDGMIDEYQKLMDEYVVIVKDVKNGKTSEMSKMQDLSTKTTEWSKKLSDIAPKLSVEQSERIRKISENAASQMQ